MPSTCSVFSTTRRALVAALAPMLTWSSWPLLLTMLSTEAGVQSCLFWLTMPAAVYCGIIRPEFRPGSATRNGGKPRCPLNQLVRAPLRNAAQLSHGYGQEIERQGQRLAMEIAAADRMASSSGKMLGLSVTELHSVSTTCAT